MIGQAFGNYRVTSRLGEGGMGTVYRATDTMLDRDVALKVLRPELARQAALVERFRAEAVALARLRHEHIAALYGLDRQGDELVMVMEYVSGETLESRLARDGTMPWQEAIPVVRAVLAALGHAHVRGVVHRDIKPANVMIDADGLVKVMDFGIARLIGENRQTRAGVAVGTPSYMAPEQLRGEDVDGRTDLYAAGALLFELLTGRVAFQADSDYALMMQQLHEAPPAPSTLRPGVPRKLDAMVARAMAKLPAQRFSSATDFSRALEAIAPEAPPAEPIREVAASMVARAPRDWRVYAIGVCLVSAALLGAATMQRRPLVPPDGTAVVAGERQRAPAEPEVVATPAGMIAGAATGKAAGVGVGGGGGGVGSGPDTRPVVTASRKPDPAPVARTEPVRAPDAEAPKRPAARPPARSKEPTPAAQPVARTGTAPTEATPPRAVTTPPVVRERDDADGPAAAGARAQELMQRCVAAIAGNDGGAAGRLLTGQSAGLLAAVSEGRITSASLGAVDMAPGDDHFTARGGVRITWKTAFGGNKAGTAALSAAVTRAGGGWRGSGCSVGSDGGVR